MYLCPTTMAIAIVATFSLARADTTPPAASHGSATRRTITVDGVAFDITVRAQPHGKHYELGFTIDARSADKHDHVMAAEPVNLAVNRACRNRDGSGTAARGSLENQYGADGWDQSTRITAADSAHWSRVVVGPGRRRCQVDAIISIASFTFANGRKEKLKLARVQLDVQKQPRITIHRAEQQ